LLKNKTRPRECVEEVPEWCGVHLQLNLNWGAELPLHRVQQEREARARLKREKKEVRQSTAHSRRKEPKRVLQREAREREEVR